MPSLAGVQTLPISFAPSLLLGAVPDDFVPVRGQLGSRLLIRTGLLDEQGPNKPHSYLFSQGRLKAVP